DLASFQPNGRFHRDILLANRTIDALPSFAVRATNIVIIVCHCFIIEADEPSARPLSLPTIGCVSYSTSISGP
ncbi:hypothetical protein, partial [Yoonia sp.]|uniref:hypothetical protein n=1 Tax=Yoonia sp. TaxID=2212373 RepID=UPI0035C86001